MKRQDLAISLLCAGLLLLTQAQAGFTLPAFVRVKLFSSQPQITRLYLRAPLMVHWPVLTRLTSGRYIISTEGGALALRRASGNKIVAARGKTITIEAVGQMPVSVATGELAVPHLYKGKITIGPSATGGLSVVNTVDCKSYVSSCVGSESLPGFAEEALKAQAVLCSTLLDGNLRGTKLVEDSTEDQSYLGAGAERAEVRRAVDAVFGQELFYGTKPIRVYYCSTCGGKTATPQIFGGKAGAPKYPYLRALDCKFCHQSPFARDLVKTVSGSQLQSKTGINSLAVKQSLDGRPLQIDVDKGHGAEMWSGYQLFLAIGKAFGWGFLPSTRFAIARDGASFRFTSRGCGHGVGLCQWGADGQARAGRDYRDILQFYFPGTRIKVIGHAND